MALKVLQPNLIGERKLKREYMYWLRVFVYFDVSVLIQRLHILDVPSCTTPV